MTGESDVAAVRGIVDTSIVIHLSALDPSDLPDEMVLSTITLAELSAGPLHTDDEQERARRLSVLQHAESTFDPLPFDAMSARSFGQVSAAVLATGRTPRRRIADLLIAATALAYGLPLFTTNPHDFTGLGSLVHIVPVPRPPSDY